MLRWRAHRSGAARRPAGAAPASARQSPDLNRQSVGPAFTLIELLAVVLIIILLAGLVIGVSGYARLRMMKNRAQTEIAIISAICEAFKTDAGRYPTSSVYRMTGGSPGWFETWNSSTLGSQLANGGYLWGKLPIRTHGGNSPFDLCHTVTNKSVATQIHPTTFTNLLNVIVDPWESPYNYFCTYPASSACVRVTINTPCAYAGYTYDPVTSNWVPSTGSVTNKSEPYVGGQVNIPTFDLWSYGPDMKSAPTCAGSVAGNADDIGNFQY